MVMARKKRDPKKVALAQAILDAYQPETAEIRDLRKMIIVEMVMERKL